MTKYSEKLTETIVDLITEELFSITEICKGLNISRKTFYSWTKTKPEFREEIDRAIEQRDETVLAMAHSSLKERLSNYTLTEEKDTYIPDESDPSVLVLKSKIIRKKEYLPDLRTIKMVLDRADKKKAKQRKQEEEKIEKAMPEVRQTEVVTEENNAPDNINTVYTTKETVSENQTTRTPKSATNNKTGKGTTRRIKVNIRVLSKGRGLLQSAKKDNSQLKVTA
jgi:transposase-like protein